MVETELDQNLLYTRSIIINGVDISKRNLEAELNPENIIDGFKPLSNTHRRLELQLF